MTFSASRLLKHKLGVEFFNGSARLSAQMSAHGCAVLAFDIESVKAYDLTNPVVLNTVMVH